MDDAMMFICMCNVRPEDRISVEELRNKIELNNMMGMFTESKITMISLSRINGRECLV